MVSHNFIWTLLEYTDKKQRLKQKLCKICVNIQGGHGFQGLLSIVLLFLITKKESRHKFMITRELYDEKETLVALARGDEGAFVLLFNSYSPKVYRTALKFLNSKDLAEETVQDVFMDIWLYRERMSEVLNFGGYLQGMVRRQVFDTFKKNAAFSDIIKDLSYHEPTQNLAEQIIQENEYDDFLQEIISKLPEHQQEIFRLAKEEELSHEEIAQRLNLSRLAVKSHMKRILRFIRERLEPILKASLLTSFFSFF